MTKETGDITITANVMALLAEKGIVRPRDLEAVGIPGSYLFRLYRRGQVERLARGLYALPNASVSEYHAFALASKQVTAGVICLLSAMAYHGLTTQLPRQVWLAISNKAYKPRIKYPPLKVVWFSPEAMSAGVEIKQIDGVPVHIFNPAKTVADAFKYRNKIGLDVAIEALRDCLEQRKCTPAELWQYAKVCRVNDVMRPYIEAMV